MYRNLLSGKLGETTLTIDWLQNILETAMDQDSELIGWYDRKIGNQEMLSDIIEVSLTWKEHEDDELIMPKTVVLKVPKDRKMGLQREERSNGQEYIKTIHRSECLAYNWLNENMIDIPLPKIYHTQEINDEDDGVIVMEDMKNYGFVPSFIDGLNLDQILTVIESLAKLHSCSMKNNDWIEMIPNSPTINHYAKYSAMFAIVGPTLKSMRPDYFDDIDILAPFYTAEYGRSIIEESHTEVGLKPVLVHGDLWCNNLIFDVLEPDKLLAIIDWQMVQKGNPCLDIAQLLMTSMDPDRRRQERENILKFYHEKLVENLDEDKDISLDRIMQGYDKVLNLMASYFIIGLPFAVNSALVGEGEEKEENIEKLLFRGKCLIEDVLENVEK